MGSMLNVCDNQSLKDSQNSLNQTEITLFYCHFIYFILNISFTVIEAGVIGDGSVHIKACI